jgi:hypothetical protein
MVYQRKRKKKEMIGHTQDAICCELMSTKKELQIAESLRKKNKFEKSESVSFFRSE